MNVQETVWRLLGGLGLLLAVASAIGFALSRRTLTEAGRATVDNLNDRIRAWWVMVAIFGVAFLAGPLVTIALFAVVSCKALAEYGRAIALDTRPIGLRLRLLWALVVAQYLLIATDWYGLYSIFLPVYGFLAVLALSALHGQTDDLLPRVAKAHVGLMLCAYCISHAPALMLLRIPGFSAGQPAANALLLFFLLLVVQLSDVLQYVFGKLFGKTPLAPRVSPSKTVEGLVGGGVSATAIAAAMWWITPFTPWQAGLLGALVVAGGVLGGLAMSALKRSAGVKDWGTAIKGHGGVLDRMDSVLFAAPLFFHAVRYFFVP